MGVAMQRASSLESLFRDSLTGASPSASFSEIDAKSLKKLKYQGALPPACLLPHGRCADGLARTGTWARAASPQVRAVALQPALSRARAAARLT